MWKKFLRDCHERFANWETFNGFFLFIPWGAGFIWYGIPSKALVIQYSIFHERFGYNYGMVSLGAVLVIWGLRKIQVNRIKQEVNKELLKVKHRIARGIGKL